ncbi:hypothetical protein V6N12_054853 [Hibiscus sabdariffa]|uniref:Uncharacterized protein n=1 Tax=Hibiscus sabdariffa TaxID=183260 RepID=A0ABR2D1P0_9ROSI
MGTQKERNVYSNQRYQNIHVNAEKRRKGSLRSEPGPESLSEGKVKRKISGHVEEEDTGVDKVSWAKKLEQQFRKAESKLEGSSESSSEEDRGTHVVEDEHSDGLEKDAINDLLIGKDLAVNMGKDLGNLDRHIGESDLVGDFNCRDASNSGGGNVEGTVSRVKIQETAMLRVGGDRVEVMDPNNASNSPHQVDLEIPSLKAFEDIHNMGLSHGLADKDTGGRVVSVEEQIFNNQAQDVLVDRSRLGVSEDVENGASFFPEMDYAKQCGKLKSKKKQKRNKSLRREKK